MCSASSEGDDLATLTARVVASEARVLAVGLPTSRNASHLRAQGNAPARVAAQLLRDEGNPYTETGIDLRDPTQFADLGSLAVDCDDEFDRIRSVAATIAARGHLPLFLGGDHSVTYPILAGLHSVLGPVRIVHFDAHPDLYADFEGNPYSHASPFARILEGGFARSLWQYGIRTLTPHQREQVARFGVHCHDMRHYRRWSLPKGSMPTYVSIDLDALDPACAPGVAHREPGGLSVRQVLDLIDLIPGPIIGADVVEYLPQRDVDGLTALAAAKLARELVGALLRPAPAPQDLS